MIPERKLAAASAMKLVDKVSQARMRSSAPSKEAIRPVKCKWCLGRLEVGCQFQQFGGLQLRAIPDPASGPSNSWLVGEL